MLHSTHIALGLVLGGISGDYATALFASLIPDADHVVHHIKNGKIFHPLASVKTALDPEDPAGDQRHILHNILTWVLVCAGSLFVAPGHALVFAVGYGGHLVLDMLDASPFYPLFPLRRYSISGFIRYASFLEHILAASFFVFFLVYQFFLQ